MGLRINDILEEQGVSISELGRRINKSRSTVHATLEKGNPQYSTLVEIAEALNVDIKDLFHSDKEDGTTGFIEHNGTVYKINSISDIEKLLEKVKGEEKATKQI